jgi:hypothetical protein
MKTHWPLLHNSDPPSLPDKGKGCIVCGKPLTRGFAYISGGATYDLHKWAGRDISMGAFLNIGFHGKLSDMSDSGDVKVVDDLDGGQFDLLFCSIACLRRFFGMIVDAVEKDIGKRMARIKKRRKPNGSSRARGRVVQKDEGV